MDLMRLHRCMLPQGGARHPPHRHPAMHRIKEDKAMTIPHSAAQRRGLRWREQIERAKPSLGRPRSGQTRRSAPPKSFGAGSALSPGANAARRGDAAPVARN